MKLWKMVFGIFLAAMVTSLAYTQRIERGTFIGITMPESSKRFFNNDDVFKAEAEKRSFSVEIQYADDYSQQNQQIIDFLKKGVKALIIRCFDNDYIVPVIKRASRAGVPVIAYDRFITNANYTITANHFRVGFFQAKAL